MCLHAMSARPWVDAVAPHSAVYLLAPQRPRAEAQPSRERCGGQKAHRPCIRGGSGPWPPHSRGFVLAAMDAEWLFGRADSRSPSPDAEPATGEALFPEQQPSIIGQRAVITYFQDGTKAPVTSIERDTAPDASQQAISDLTQIHQLFSRCSRSPAYSPLPLSLSLPPPPRPHRRQTATSPRRP